MKATTVRDIMSLAAARAAAQGITGQEALDALVAEYEMICFLGMWTCPDAEVWVSADMPVPGRHVPGIKIY